ncbi:MAG: putative Holliday junction resolvase [candidate division WS2 bacterium ADurb.Bin280]|uniref:Putative pre-16S rRNA nuclease n=1 Tax=candidate division WS2 bacterium ADurb.Bin280 TaxID=1852829 RepID=A0A1V5SED0_9BACT|nr:MAG: putative Holliday junction resolvase [candidate division WS2 bacterium ADurb.Bin280]
MSNILQKTLLGIDLGEKRTGLAISHGFATESLGYLDFSRKDEFFKKLKEIVDEQKVQLCVVGLPLAKNGEETMQSRWTREAAKEIADRAQIPIVFQEESFTSTQALEELGKIKKKGEIDARSASLILQRYIDEESASQ